MLDNDDRLLDGGFLEDEAVDEAPKARFTCRGDVSQLYRWLDYPEEAPREVVFEGVPGSAKTRNILEWMLTALRRYPATPTIIVREVRASLADSVLPILEEEVLGLEHEACEGPMRENRRKYRSPTEGWSISLGGYDQPRKIFSTQWGIFYFNEMQETELIKWVQLARSRRARGARRGVEGSKDKRLPFRILLGDCNPENENHWINQRACAGGAHPRNECPSQMHRLIGRFWDNPLYYNAEDKVWTPEGEDFVAGLRASTTGTVFYERHVDGKWVSAQGQVWATYDQHASRISGGIRHDDDGQVYLWVPEWDKRIYFSYFVGAHDWGFAEPTCAQLWGIDSEGRAYRLLEGYAPGLSDDEWAKIFWGPVWDMFHPVAILTDWNGALRKSIRSQLGLALTDEEDTVVMKWSKRRDPKGEKTGIDIARRRFKRRTDGTRGIYFVKEAHVFSSMNPLPDAEEHPAYATALRERQLFTRFGLPSCTEEEIGAWIYPPLEKRKNRDEPDPDGRCADHGCDATRGVMDWLEYKEIEPGAKPRYIPGTLGDVLRHAEVFGED